jgi:hypothetical protein
MKIKTPTTTKQVTKNTVTQKHYSRFNGHLEDLIYKDKQYIVRLQTHIHSVYERLAQDLKLNEHGKDLLFDFIFNFDDLDIEFEEFINRYNVVYADLVK